MTTGRVNEKNLEKHIEKQMGCMAGFLQIFDRHLILSGKHNHSTKRLPPPSGVVTTPSSGTSATTSPAISKELGKSIQEKPRVSPAEMMRSPPSPPPELPPKSPLPLPILQLKEGSKSTWKFSKEAPRLSLDSRATTDAKGSLHPREIRTSAAVPCGGDENGTAADGLLNRSPSVIARLMGLEPPLPSSSNAVEKKPELRRSASESRVSRDLFHSRFIMEDTLNYSSKNITKAEEPKGLNRGGVNPMMVKTTLHRKSFFDSGDVFPEPKQSVSIYGEIEKRLKMRGINEPSRDLETLKQILEALQLKGLLHSKKPSEQSPISYRNFVYEQSPVVLMKPSRSPMASPVKTKPGNGYSPSNDRNQARGIRRNHDVAGERNLRSPTRQGRSSISPVRSDPSNEKRSNSLIKPRPLSVETRSRVNESTQNHKVSHINSPKMNRSKTGSHETFTNRSPRNKKSMAEIHRKEKITTVVAEDESSTLSESTASTSSHTDSERSKMGEHKEGRSLLERCDKLLNSIAEMNAPDSQPSPVSVLDSFESPSPSPIIMKRRIDFKDQSGELEDEIWTPVISPMQSKCLETSEDSEFLYVCDILRASHYLPDNSDTDIFMLLEKQQYLEGKNTSKISTLSRKLTFDTINEILDQTKQLPPWKSIAWTHENVWSEFKRIRALDTAEDLFETICGILRKDLARDALNGWGDCPVEMSEAVLDIERLVFKDLISETIRELALLSSKSKFSGMPRRKLVFY